MSGLAAGQSSSRPPISVNGKTIARTAIAREAQHHSSPSPGDAMQRAGEALVLRELLLQASRQRDIQAAPAIDEEGRRETEDEALIRELVDSQVSVPVPSDDEVARYYEANSARFRSPDLFEVRHILIAARSNDKEAFAAARAKAETIAAELAVQPDNFADLARVFSNCPSAPEGGHLGQLTASETTPEFSEALAKLAVGETTTDPVEARYGFHIIRLERRIDGRILPLTAVAERIADYLAERSQRTASTQYLARLVSAADIRGIDIAGAEQHRVF
jgi:peptidyl-prolyl cis-trans isomerase C